MKMNKITVVIPYFNDSKSIERSLKSLLKQTLLPYEVIIVDDCSEDSKCLTRIVDNFTELNVSVIRNKTNKNGAYSRNKGVNLSKSEYIAFLDADDYFLEDHLRLSLDGLITNEADFVYSNVVEVDKNGAHNIRKVTDLKMIQGEKADILFFSPPQTNSFFFKRSVYSKVRFDAKLSRHQDYQFFMDVIDNVNTAYLDINTSCYTINVRDFKSRKGYFDSMFCFWSEREKHFSKRQFNKKMLKFLPAIISLEPEKLDYYLKEYSCFDSVNSLVIIKLCKLIGFRYTRFFLKYLIVLRLDRKYLFNKLFNKLFGRYFSSLFKKI